MTRGILLLLSCIVFYTACGDSSERPVRQPTSSQPSSSKGLSLLVTNGGVEAGDQTPEGWSKGKSVPGVEYIWAKGIAHEGQASLCLKKTQNRFWPIAEWYQRVQNPDKAERFRISAWVKTDQAKKAIIDVKWGAGHKWIAYIGEENGGPPANHNWKKYSDEVMLPEGTDRFTVALQIYGPGTVWFDSIEVTPVSQ